MEEKNGTQTPPECGADKPAKDKKRKKLTRRRAVAGIYLGIAVCMLAVLTVSLVNTNEKVQSDLENLSDIGTKLPDISFPKPEKNLPAPPVPPAHKQADTKVPGVDAKVTLPPDVKPPAPAAKYVLPVEGAVLKGYSADALVFSDTMQDFRTHNGVDLAAALGSKVAAYTDGTVTRTAKDPFMGVTVEISHKAGVVSVYKNLGKELFVSEGDVVKAGQQIATVGRSAILEIADEPHLHFELWMNGEQINAETELAALKH